MALFGRICKIAVGTGGGNVDDEYLVFDQSFRLTFDITWNAVQANQCTVQIYNMNSDHRNDFKNIIKENDKRKKSGLPLLQLLVFAGYEEGDGLELLFIGDIVHPSLTYQAPDWIHQITAYPKVLDFKTKFLPIAYQAGIDTTSILKQLADELEMKIDASSNLGTAIRFANGVSLAGTAKNSLDTITELAGLRYVVTANNTLKIAPIGLPSDEEALLLNTDTGLINPVKDLDAQGFQLADPAPLNGYEVDSLLQPKATPFKPVQIESKEVTGKFFIQSVEHKGDTRGPEWWSIMQVKEHVL
jgi:hypothetical protein